MLNPFSWVRQAAKNAFIGGIVDGATELAGDGTALIVRLELPALAAGDVTAAALGGDGKALADKPKRVR